MAQTTLTARSHEDLYRAKPQRPELVEVPAATFLTIDGRGDPNTSPDFSRAVQALYSAAYTIKFASKKAGGPDYRVPPLEGLWWGAEGQNFAAETKGEWSWTLMIRLPDGVPPQLVTEALAAAEARKPELAIGALRVEPFAEGLSAQVMHVGPYAEEGPTVAALHRFIADQGRRLRGLHHEIYLGDPRRSAPEKLRTLVRQPVE